MGIRPLILTLAIVLSLACGATAGPKRAVSFDSSTGEVLVPKPSIQLQVNAGAFFSVDGSGFIFKFGDFNTVNHGSFLSIDDAAQTAALTAANGFTLNGSSAVKKFLTTTTTWNPGNLVNGASEAKITISFPGVAVGDVIIASLSTITSSFWDIQAVAVGADVADVRITNNTGGTVDLASGTLRLVCIKF
jgi:hypothetical protein